MAVTIYSNPNIAKQLKGWKPPFSLELAQSAMLMKQQKFDSGAQALQNKLGMLSNLDVAKDEDKEMLQSKVKALTDNLNQLGGLDLSDANVVNSLSGMIGGIASDKEILNAVASTRNYRDYNAQVDAAREKGTYADANNFVLSDPINKWLKDGKAGSALGRVNYEDYKDISPEFYKMLDKMGLDSKNIVDAYGRYMLRNTDQEILSTDKVMGAYKQLLDSNPQLARQAYFNAVYQYRNHDNATITGLMAESASHQLKELDKDIEAKQAQFSALKGQVGKNDEEKEFIKQRLAIYERGISDSKTAREAIAKRTDKSALLAEMDKKGPDAWKNTAYQLYTGAQAISHANLFSGVKKQTVTFSENKNATQADKNVETMLDMMKWTQEMKLKERTVAAAELAASNKAKGKSSDGSGDDPSSAEDLTYLAPGGEGFLLNGEAVQTEMVKHQTAVNKLEEDAIATLMLDGSTKEMFEAAKSPEDKKRVFRNWLIENQVNENAPKASKNKVNPSYANYIKQKQALDDRYSYYTTAYQMGIENWKKNSHTYNEVASLSESVNLVRNQVKSELGNVIGIRQGTLLRSMGIDVSKLTGVKEGGTNYSTSEYLELFDGISYQLANISRTGDKLDPKVALQIQGKGKLIKDFNEFTRQWLQTTTMGNNLGKDAVTQMLQKGLTSLGSAISKSSNSFGTYTQGMGQLVKKFRESENEVYKSISETTRIPFNSLSGLDKSDLKLATDALRVALTFSKTKIDKDSYVPVGVGYFNGEWYFNYVKGAGKTEESVPNTVAHPGGKAEPKMVKVSEEHLTHVPGFMRVMQNGSFELEQSIRNSPTGSSGDRSAYLNDGQVMHYDIVVSPSTRDSERPTYLLRVKGEDGKYALVKNHEFRSVDAVKEQIQKIVQFGFAQGLSNNSGGLDMSQQWSVMEQAGTMLGIDKAKFQQLAGMVGADPSAILGIGQ